MLQEQYMKYFAGHTEPISFISVSLEFITDKIMMLLINAIFKFQEK